MSLEHVKIGPCAVSFNGADLGTTSGGVTLSIAMNTTDRLTMGRPKGGHSPISDGYKISATIPFAETLASTLYAVCPGATLVTSTVTFKNIIGEALRDYAKALTLTPQDGSMIITLPKALPTINASYAFSLQNQRVLQVTFDALYDDSDNLMTIQYL
jgi:hypothetical protein